MNPRFFPTPTAFRKWLAANHAKAQELWVGFYRKDSGKPSITWPESVEEALCFGWIDGIRKRVDQESYMIRFTPRRSTSVWSAINIRNVERLRKEKRMQPAGLKAFELHKESKSRIYSYEQRSAEMPESYAVIFRRNKTAWEFFEAQSPAYRKIMNWYILSAKREETRLKRLQRLMEASAKGERVR